MRRQIIPETSEPQEVIDEIETAETEDPAEQMIWPIPHVVASSDLTTMSSIQRNLTFVSPPNLSAVPLRNRSLKRSTFSIATDAEGSNAKRRRTE